MKLTLVKFNEDTVWSGAYAVRHDTIRGGFPCYLDLEYPERFKWGIFDTHFIDCVLYRPDLLIERFGRGIVRKTRFMDFFDTNARSLSEAEVAVEILSGN